MLQCVLDKTHTGRRRQPINILIFGGTGKELIKLALASGHRVTAVVRRPEALELHHENLSVWQGDALKLASFSSALTGQDAVLSALGMGTSRKPTTLYSEGTRNIIQAMRTAGITRFTGVTASGFVSDPNDGFLLTYVMKPLIGRILKHPYADMMRMEAEMRQSALEWTIVRPTRLTDGPRRGCYRTVVGGTGNVPSGMTISRADVADFMVTRLTNPEIFGKVVGIAY